MKATLTYDGRTFHVVPQRRRGACSCYGCALASSPPCSDIEGWRQCTDGMLGIWRETLGSRLRRFFAARSTPDESTAAIRYGTTARLLAERDARAVGVAAISRRAAEAATILEKDAKEKQA